MSSEVLPVELGRRRRAQTAQHALAALMLVSYAADHFSKPHAGIAWLALAEIGAALLLVVAVVRERRHKSHGGIAWVEIAGALMALVEAIERTQGRHHRSFIVLSYAAPAVLLIFALFDARISAMRYIKADDDSFEVRLRLLFRRRIPWKDVRAFRISGKAIECELTGGGTQRFKLSGVSDRAKALAWSAEQFRRRGIPESAQ